jgi:hypothetical protein
MTTIVNLTPHSIVILTPDDQGSIIGHSGYGAASTVNRYRVLKEYPSRGVARVSATQERVGTVDGVPLVSTVFGEVQGLPEYREDICMIVSLVTYEVAKSYGRTTYDLLVPGELVRSAQGNIIGCTSLGV